MNIEMNLWVMGGPMVVAEQGEETDVFPFIINGRIARNLPWGRL